ncbi:ThuA domain-containing protein [Allorhodopirellula solitaria]|uniref:Trehalose utilization n=1 Tax=Allorhodopirellula solitaria TaxID=2527987 RepID=A0A5C5XQX3_9BACT|nr:ThuA domain-containing protein [Allorhodopirellula solitaria]TWT65300.1 Trehalose utilization [Allorhodopirellula solitaria]
MTHKSITFCLLVLAILLSQGPHHAQANDGAADSSPLKVLLVAGGCCHDYPTQSKLLKEGIEARLHADVTVALSPNATTRATFEIYQSDDWAEGYDVVVHDECSADVTDKAYVERILAAHRSGVPAVNLHCAMHSYRWGDFRKPVEQGAENSKWYEMIGLQSTGHGPKFPIDVVFTNADHPATKGLENWTTINEELYNNVRVMDGTTALASGKQAVPPNKRQLKRDPDAKGNVSEAVVVWTSEYGPKQTKIFSTTLGHQNETVADARYLDLVVRGLLWTTGNLSEEGEPVAALMK